MVAPGSSSPPSGEEKFLDRSFARDERITLKAEAMSRSFVPKISPVGEIRQVHSKGLCFGAKFLETALV